MPDRPRTVRGARIAAATVLVAALALVDGAAAQIRRLQPPEPLPAFAFPDLDGRTHRLEDYRGRPLVLSLWATWCMPCRYELPEFLKARREIAKTHPEATLMTVNIGDGAVEIRAFLKKQQLDFPVLLAPTSFVDNVGVNSIPTLMVIDRSGRVTFVQEGWAQGIDLTAELTEEIDALGSSAAPTKSPATTKVAPGGKK